MNENEQLLYQLGLFQPSENTRVPVTKYRPPTLESAANKLINATKLRRTNQPIITADTRSTWQKQESDKQVKEIDEKRQRQKNTENFWKATTGLMNVPLIAYNAATGDWRQTGTGSAIGDMAVFAGPGLLSLGRNIGKIAINSAVRNNKPVRNFVLSRELKRNLGNPETNVSNPISLFVTPTQYNKPLTSLKFFERPSKLSKSEIQGVPKSNRNFIPRWHIAYYPGYQLKGLMKGSPLERQISKNGTININQLNSYFNKASQIEREVANKVLAEKFSGQKTINYNQFKKAIQDELIGSYNRVPQTEWADYGMEGLGFETQINHDGNAIAYNEITGNFEQVAPFTPFRPNYQLNTFTFESPRIPYGNTKHYGGNPIGHSRTYTLSEDPHTLYVMESQSDWAQQALRKKGSIDAQSAYERASQTATKHQQEIEQMKANLEKGLAPDGHKIQYEWERRDIEEIIKNTEKQLASNNARAARFDAILRPEKYVQENYLKQNYLQRQLQENLRYAAENGQIKMRYPTSETAAKIEGYKKEVAPRPTRNREIELRDQLDKMWKEYYDANESQLSNASLLELEQIGRKNIPNYAKIMDELKQLRSIPDKYEYTPKHQTILKKYADFPKLFQKLFKDQKVKTVTDTKGNTWYEVNVPKGYLSREWQFRKGGKL